jgi:hypothetical protein
VKQISTIVFALILIISCSHQEIEPMSERVSSPDFVELDAETLELLYAIPVSKRKWGMRVEVYNDGTPANNGVYLLTYNEASSNKADNDNWVLQPDINALLGLTDFGDLANFDNFTTPGIYRVYASSVDPDAFYQILIVAEESGTIKQYRLFLQSAWVASISGGPTTTQISYMRGFEGRTFNGVWSAWTHV